MYYKIFMEYICSSFFNWNINPNYAIAYFNKSKEEMHRSKHVANTFCDDEIFRRSTQ